MTALHNRDYPSPFYDEEDYYDEEEGSSCLYDNPNYDDNLDMDQQSTEFWNDL